MGKKEKVNFDQLYVLLRGIQFCDDHQENFGTTIGYSLFVSLNNIPKVEKDNYQQKVQQLKFIYSGLNHLLTNLQNSQEHDPLFSILCMFHEEQLEKIQQTLIPSQGERPELLTYYINFLNRNNSTIENRLKTTGCRLSDLVFDRGIISRHQNIYDEDFNIIKQTLLEK